MPIDAEFSRPFALDSLPPGVPRSSSRRPPRSAARSRPASISRSFCARGEVRIEPADAGTLVHVAGHLEADAVQSCVVTLEPVAAGSAGGLRPAVRPRVAGRGAGRGGDRPEAELRALPHSGKLDLGEILAEELSLALDPYPKAPEADQACSRSCSLATAARRTARSACWRRCASIDPGSPACRRGQPHGVFKPQTQGRPGRPRDAGHRRPPFR